MNEFIAISVADFEAPYGSTPPKKSSSLYPTLVSKFL